MGLAIYDNSGLTTFYSYYILLILFKIFIELLYHFQISLTPRKRIKYGYVEVDQNLLYESIVEKLNSGSNFLSIISSLLGNDRGLP